MHGGFDVLLDDLNEGGMDVTGLLIATPDHGDPGTGCQCAPGLALGARENEAKRGGCALRAAGRPTGRLWPRRELLASA